MSDGENDSAVRRAYREGFARALWLYAWFRDGELYVGTGVHTYADAIKNEPEEWEESHARLYEQEQGEDTVVDFGPYAHDRR